MNYVDLAKNLGIGLLATFPVWGSVTIILIKKFWEPADDYFKVLASILGIADDISDRLVIEFPNNPLLETVDDIVDKVKQELVDAGYDITDMEKEIRNHIMSNLEKKEGTSVKWKDGKLKLEVNKSF